MTAPRGRSRWFGSPGRFFAEGLEAPLPLGGVALPRWCQRRWCGSAVGPAPDALGAAPALAQRPRAPPRRYPGRTSKFGVRLPGGPLPGGPPVGGLLVGQRADGSLDAGGKGASVLPLVGSH